MESNGALECFDCPHPVGANCDTLDAQWEDVYANKYWWTRGTRANTFYKCPYENTCEGGNVTKNGTIKSSCAVGYVGIVCAVCADEYVFHF